MGRGQEGTVPFWVTAVAGGVGGMAQVVVGNPLDVIKTRMQRGQPVEVSARALFRGMTVPLMASSGLNLVLFSVTGRMRALLHDYERNGPIVPLPKVVAAALLTAPIYVAFVTPVELIKVRLMTGASGSNLAAVIRDESKGGGLMRGYLPTCAMRLWGLPFYFGGNEATKTLLLARQQQEPLSKAQLMFAGGMAGVFFWLACFPFDTIKTVVQSQQGMTPIRAAKSIWQQEGGSVRNFYRGITPCLVRSFPANAVVFVTVDVVQKALMD